MFVHEYNDTIEREINLWLEQKNITAQIYKRLQPGDKEALLGQLSVPKRPASYKQLKDLYRKLCLIDVGGRVADPIDSMTYESLDKFFTATAPSKTLSYLEKF